MAPGRPARYAGAGPMRRPTRRNLLWPGARPVSDFGATVRCAACGISSGPGHAEADPCPADGPDPVTPPEGWPFKRIKIRDKTYDVPDVLVRSG